MNPPRTQMDADVAAQGSAQPFMQRHGSSVCAGALGNLGLQAQDPGLSQLQLEIFEKCIPSHGVSVGTLTRAVNPSTSSYSP